MSLGIGLSAFVDGFNKGWGIGDRVVQGVRTGQRKKAFKQARSDYDKQIADNVMTQAGQADPNQAFDAEAAAKDARKQMSFTDFVYKERLPGIIDDLVANGDLEMAEGLRKWGDDAKQRKNVELFGKNLGFAALGQQSGNYAKWADSAVDLLNNSELGVTATGYDFVTDDKGNQTGITFKLKDKDGKELQPYTFNSIEEGISFIANNSSPQSMAQRWLERQKQADALRAKTMEKQIDANIGLGKEVAIEGVRQGNRIALEDRRTENQMWQDAASAGAQDPKVRAAATTKAQILREAGYKDDQINKWMPALLGIREETRQAMSGDDLVKFAMETLSKTDEAYMDGDQATRQRLIRDFITAFKTEAQQVQSRQPSQAPGIGAQPQARPPLY